MAIRARVELKGCLTHDKRGRSFKKGHPQILTNPADIAYYKAQPEFSVKVLSEVAPRQPTVAPPRKGGRPQPAPVQADTEDDDDTAEDDDDTETEEPAEDEEPADGPAEPTYTKTQLEGHKVGELRTLGEDFQLTFPADATKKTMVAAILKAQLERLKSE